MSINEFITYDQTLIDRLATGDRAATLHEAQARGEAELAGAASLADQIEITMRLAATAALGETPGDAEATVIWAARCARLLVGPAAEAYYLPRLSALVGGVVSRLDSEVRPTIVTGLQSWMSRAGAALEAVSTAERDADADALIALAADGVADAGELAKKARGRAIEQYRTAGRPGVAAKLRES
ncbi:MAG: hypothetical protein HKO87_00860 [Acidimicrobiia bacterium]|nr:hypothetical protein [Acidimicrobiia bacterium]